jgi:hypothetical protein
LDFFLKFKVAKGLLRSIIFRFKEHNYKNTLREKQNLLLRHRFIDFFKVKISFKIAVVALPFLKFLIFFNVNFTNIKLVVVLERIYKI